jgi:hypothetical protein
LFFFYVYFRVSLQELINNKNPEEIKKINISYNNTAIPEDNFASNKNYSNLTFFDISIYEATPYCRGTLFKIIQQTLKKSINCKQLLLNLGNKKVHGAIATNG